jgi:V8-like Glu-specific endopeptidase
MSVDKLHFWGTQEPPLLPGEIARRLPVISDEERPRELDQLSRAHGFYVSATGTERPRVDVVQVEGDDTGGLWRVEVSGADGQVVGPRLGKSVNLTSPDAICDAIDPAIGFSSYRPSWNHLFYIPRSLPRATQDLRRFSGRRVRPLYIFGADDRRIYQDTSYPWGCVGKIYNSDGFAGSGALVGRNLVVTAGHLIPSNPSNWWMRFVPDYFDGQSLHGAGVESYVSDVHGYHGGVSGYDWALCKLYTALGDSLGYFGYNGWSSDWEKQNYWTVAGYPSDVAGGERPTWQSGVDYHDEDGDSNGGEELESNTADTSFGSSGGPMFGWWSGDPRIIAVVSGEETEYQFPLANDANNIFASGSGFTNLIAWGRTNWLP